MSPCDSNGEISSPAGGFPIHRGRLTMAMQRTPKVSHKLLPQFLRHFPVPLIADVRRGGKQPLEARS
jgi:hypothetical protein